MPIIRVIRRVRQPCGQHDAAKRHGFQDLKVAQDGLSGYLLRQDIFIALFMCFESIMSSAGDQADTVGGVA
ncbi:MAG TPA: hypothetical protein DDZ73_07330 [Gammaproteobacteria bacterium]|jgi:hypothetical protein|nr:MAG: hypothetical protein COA89_09885 [Acidithiobacillus sp.]RTZ62974.1 MAG: hypothetical protein DSZ34_09755 [Gammaproteobacteria bacterium]HAD38235.1 hypothetical protein [Gammaproteobacteria bacterium]HBK76196.1 hypothetical protein [Gammaproteobacteria bacterium]|tara:strand:- start:1712 stop:1924 length:213 start_codon:yes stop_codon:yes gene_type:complete